MNHKSKEYSQTLKKRVKDMKLTSYFKFILRPYICPLDIVLNSIGEEKKIFDIGFGNGSLLTLVSEYLSPKKIGGLEVDKDLLDNANSILSSYNVDRELILFNGSQIPRKVLNYNVITLIDVLHHIPKQNQFKFLDELFQKISPNSIVIIKDINAENPLVFFNKLHDLILSRQKTHERGLKELLNFLRKRKNIQIRCLKKSRMLVYPHYMLCLKKNE
jgi:2-polyprenyl-3-methyl-5-hydroxy-6-metoxy-1,4-benzoquinol methylase